MIVIHTVTCFIMGLPALSFLEYRTAFETPITREYMRLGDEAIVALGPALQSDSFVAAWFLQIVFWIGCKRAKMSGMGFCCS
jgi:hypothetical protein